MRPALGAASPDVAPFLKPNPAKNRSRERCQIQLFASQTEIPGFEI